MRSIALNISMPDMVNVSERDLQIMLASKLYEIKELSLGQAADTAGLSKRAFMKYWGNMAYHYLLRI